MRNLKVVITLFVFALFMLNSTDTFAQATKPAAKKATKAKSSQLQTKGVTRKAPAKNKKAVKSSREKIKANRERFMKARKTTKKRASN